MRRCMGSCYAKATAAPPLSPLQNDVLARAVGFANALLGRDMRPLYPFRVSPPQPASPFGDPLLLLAWELAGANSL